MVGIDLFAGAGGMSLGATQAGIRVGLAVESDRHAAETYRANHPATVLFNDDILHLTADDLEPWKRFSRHLVVFAGAPCQGFSWSNTRTRSLDNPANWLFQEFLRVVRVLKPSWVIFENVQGIVNIANGVILQQIQDSLAQDYHLHKKVLNAMYHGIPQNRSRFFLVGTRHGLPFQFPTEISNDSPTVQHAIGDLPPLSSGAHICCLPYRNIEPSEYALRLRGTAEKCCNHLVTSNSPLVLQRYDHIPPGGNWKNIPVPLMCNYSNRIRCHTGLYHRLRCDAVSIVIGNYRKNMLIHPIQNRGLSVREAARLQSFPDWYKFHGSIGFQQQQVGNAVPPFLARSVFEEIVHGDAT